MPALRLRTERIVLGNAGFHLAHHVAADIRTLGEDAAAETGEDGDERGAEAERNECVRDDAALRLIRDVEMQALRQEHVVAGDAD